MSSLRAAARGCPLTLGIETATMFGGVALAAGPGDLLGEVTLRNLESHAERILPAVDFLLRTLGGSLRDLDAVAVSSGPGSFTGLRAGIATAKGLAFALGVPLYGVPTLDVLAANTPPGAGIVCATINARRGEVFCSHFHTGPDGIQRLGPDRVVPADAFVSELADDTLVVGDLPAPRAGELPQIPGVRRAPSHLNFPRAGVVAFLGSRALAEGRDSELATLRPRYLRSSDAEAGVCANRAH